MKASTATAGRRDGDKDYVVLFRHPVRIDPATGRPGRRIRRSLDTADEYEADNLVAQLNDLLAAEDLWESTARGGGAAVRRAGGLGVLRRTGPACRGARQGVARQGSLAAHG